MGKLIAKILSWGADRVRMPSARLVISRMAISGSASCRPTEKITEP